MGHTQRPSDTSALAPEFARDFQAANHAAQSGHLDAAVKAYLRVLDVSPDFIPAHAGLGSVLLRLRRFAEAAQHLARVLDARPDEIPVLVGLAWALQKQADFHAAEQLYRQVLKLQPTHVQAMLGLGTSMRSLGGVDDACHWFERAALTDPDCADAYHLLSITRRFTGDEPVFQQCEARQASAAALPPIKQARYWFALGKMREDAGRFDAAFEAYARGNRARASLFVLDEADAETWLRRTCAAFDTRCLAAYPPQAAADGRVPVFVVGMPRSGTSLIEQILASHPSVYGAGEIPDLNAVVVERAGTPITWPESIPRMSDVELQAMGTAYLDRVFQRAEQATHVVNKTTLNYRHVGLIRMLLPQARIIHAMRDPMDSCFSCYTHLFDGDNLPYTYDLRHLGSYYVRYAKLMQHWREVLPGAMLEVQYEDLVCNTQEMVRRMLDYLGLPWEPACLQFHRNPRIVETASRVQVQQPIYRSSIARWRHFETQLAPLLELVGALRCPASRPNVGARHDGRAKSARGDAAQHER